MEQVTLIQARWSLWVCAYVLRTIPYFLIRTSNALSPPSMTALICLTIDLSSIEPCAVIQHFSLLGELSTTTCSASPDTGMLGLCVATIIWRCSFSVRRIYYEIKHHLIVQVVLGLIDKQRITSFYQDNGDQGTAPLPWGQLLNGPTIEKNFWGNLRYR